MTVNTAEDRGRVVLLPCNGIGQAIASVIRRACYLAVQEQPQLVTLVNASALAAEVEAEKKKVSGARVLVIDGCLDRCGQRIALDLRLPDFEVVFAPEILSSRRLSMNGVSRVRIGEKGEAIARVLKEEILARVEAMKAGVKVLPQQPIHIEETLSGGRPTTKVCVMTCSGLTCPTGTVLRQAVYAVVEELRPEVTVLGCLPATNNDVGEDIEFITNYPTIAVEGCGDECVTRVMAKKGAGPAIIVRGDRLLSRLGFVPDEEEPAVLSTFGATAARVLARKIAAVVDLLLEGGADAVSS